MQKSKLSRKEKTPSVSITKCFALNDSIIEDMTGLTNVALCDIELKKTISLPFFANLQVLIFSNNVFGVGSLSLLFENVPPLLSVLALGGSKHIARSIIPNKQANLVCPRKDIIVEVTFIEEYEDMSFILSVFPHCNSMDLVNDPMEKLTSTMKLMSWRGKKLSRALVSCNTTHFNSTPLHTACRQGDIQRCDWLITLNARHDLKDYKGCTPLHRAVERSQPPQGDISALSEEAILSDDVLGLLPEPEWPSTDSPQYSAWQCVSSCLQAGASCFVRNQNYETPLYVAALRGNGLVLYTMILHLKKQRKHVVSEVDIPLYRGSDWLSIDEKSCDIRDFSPLHAAVLCKSLYCTRLLLLAGCSPNKQNKYGSTAMHLAYRSNNAAMVDLVRSGGGCLHIKDNSGDLPVQYSLARKRHTQKKTRYSAVKKLPAKI